MARTGVDHAIDLDAYGFNVVPAPLYGKTPSIKWRPYQKIRTSDKIRAWFDGPPRNYFVITGQISALMVLDCDSDEAEAWWRERLGEAMDQTTCVRSSKGHHFWFRIPADQNDGKCRSRSGNHKVNGLVDAWDLRAEGTGAIAPPSVHETGVAYEWVRGPDKIVDAPEYLVAFAKGKGEHGEGKDGSGKRGARSMLSSLLQEPGRGGRNNWVTQVLGHYAAAHRRMPDLYEVEAERIWEQAKDLPAEDGSAYTRREFVKTKRSVWEAEMRKGLVEDGEQVEISADTGYLAKGDHCLLIQCRTKNANDEWQITLEEWADFDLEAVGVVEDENAERAYDVLIHRKRRRDTRRGLLRSKDLNNSESLAQWLGQYGVGIFPPEGVWPNPKGATDRERIKRYLESQDPPSFEVVDSLGWYEGSDGFVCHEGVIRPDGMHPFMFHRPNPRLATDGLAPYRYGFDGDWDEAQSVLREVLTFHDETVCAVFGAWWAACLLKPQIQAASSQFPFMALEAPSESGKTTGFFSMLLNLGGNTLGNTNPTVAALRDYLSGNKSGIVWIDDLSDVEPLMDLLRQATGEGSVAKKGEDRTRQAQVRLVAPICLSGESLPIRQQKALLDRAILLDVPSPTSRRSLHDPDRLQWADIIKMRTLYPDLSCLAGWYVARALALRDMVADLPLLVPGGAAGRWGDKMAVLRLGARLLAEMTGQDHFIERVDEWVSQEYDWGNENTLTIKLLPAALQALNWPNKPLPAEDRKPATPVFVDAEGVVWFSPQLLAAWWSWYQNGRIEQRTESAEALAQQARALGLGGASGDARKQFWLGHDRTKRHRYWRLSGVLADVVLRRSRGESEDPHEARAGRDSHPRPAQGVFIEQERQRSLGLVITPHDDPADHDEWLDGHEE